MRARIRAATLVEDYETILFFDEALVWPDEKIATQEELDDAVHRWKRFEETGDVSLLRIREGYEPTVWTLRHLSGMPRRILYDMVRRRDEDKPITAEGLRLCCSMSLRDVKGLDIADGEPLRITHHRDPVLGVEVVRPEVLDRIDDLVIETASGEEIPGSNIINALGALAFRKAYVGNESPRG